MVSIIILEMNIGENENEKMRIICRMCKNCVFESVEIRKLNIYDTKLYLSD